MQGRLDSIDRIRAFALLLLVFLHAAVYHFSGIFAVIDDPPPVVAVMGLFVLFGGAFIMMSGLVNTSTALDRAASGARRPGRICLDLMTTGALLLVVHFVYEVFLGPASFDWDKETRAESVLTQLIGGRPLDFDPRRLLEGSSLSTIGIGLLLLGPLLRLLLAPGIARRRLHYPILALLVLVFFSFAFFRYRYYPLAAEARAEGRWAPALLLGLLLEKPYPVLPYFSFTLLGALLAFALRETRARLILKGFTALGLAVIGTGIAFYLLAPPGLTAVTGSWFSRVLIEAGFFLIVGSLALLLVELGPRKAAGGVRRAGPKDRTFRSFGAASLSLFLLETPVSDLLARLFGLLFPLWDWSIPGVLAFGATCALFWLLLLSMWRKKDYRLSFDRFFARAQGGLGRASSRTDISNYEH